ncbi:hypothetical protein AHF37_11607 [Paragonimus kellicotti]|nr:hypothetical protein AHF37_11607 [Paragonimus kellicotti]
MRLPTHHSSQFFFFPSSLWLAWFDFSVNIHSSCSGFERFFHQKYHLLSSGWHVLLSFITRVRMDNDPSTSTIESSSHDGISVGNVTAVSPLTLPYSSTDHTSVATQSSNPGDNLSGQYVSPALLTSETTGLMDNTPSNVDISTVPISSSSLCGASRTTTTAPMIQSVPFTKTSAGPPTVSPCDYIYHIKWICFRGASRPIVTQNENGPCPMIAIANVLLLRGTMNIPEGSELLTGQRLVSLLSEILLSPPCLESEQLLNYETTVSDALNLFPSLQTGLDINVRFTGVSAFEFTPALSIFDLFKIPLYHGWLVEPEDMALSSIVGGRSYNQLAERIIELKASADPELKNQGALAEDFLDQTASQLTYHGLCELSSTVSEGQLAVFFRNNHFNTIFKNDVSTGFTFCSPVRFDYPLFKKTHLTCFAVSYFCPFLRSRSFQNSSKGLTQRLVQHNVFEIVRY